MDGKQAIGAGQTINRSASLSPPPKLAVQHDHAGIQERDLDRAYKYLESKDDGSAPADELSMRALRRKIDWRIVPIMFACYTMQFIDKVLLNVRVHLLPPLPSLVRQASLSGSLGMIVRRCDGPQ